MPQVSQIDCIPILADKARGLSFHVRGLRAAQALDEGTRMALWAKLAEVVEQVVNVAGPPPDLAAERIAKLLPGGA